MLLVVCREPRKDESNIMKILQINITYKMGSTGKIMSDLNDVIEADGNEGYMLCGYSEKTDDLPNLYSIHTDFIGLMVRKELLESRITGRMGYSRSRETKKAIKWMQMINPDVIHLHNIHGNWINVFLLMDYIKEYHIPVVWTLHDCWSFTGRCSHFEHYGCNRWIDGCYDCHNNSVYPITYFFDRSRKMWIDKKKAFSNLDRLTLVTPSEWLFNYVKKSYFRDKDLFVINNGIDLNTFCPNKTKSQHYKNVCEKKIILGVASSWTERKGLNDIYELSKQLDADKYQVVLVGLNSHQLSKIPEGIQGIGRTNNVKELVELYSGATVFVNPTYEDNYPTVNLEAIACGTPVVTYRTGGSAESITQYTGKVVEQGEIMKMLEGVENISRDRNRYRTTCREYAEKNFNKKDKYQQYIKIYKSMMEE